MSELNYKVNDYLTLKLENDKTFIYIKNKRFINCIRLMLQIPKVDIENFEEVNSIDEAASLHKTLYQNIIFEDNQPHTITPEQEFWGHCSNIQAWAENEYDSRLIHSNIAFPLLKKLTEEGDPQAKRVYKNEIAERLSAGYIPVSIYLINNYFLNVFNEEERELLVKNFMEIIDQLEEEYCKKGTYVFLNEIGNALNKIEEYGKAIEFLNRALEKNKNYMEAYNNLGVAYFYLKDYAKAEDCYLKASKLQPYQHMVWSNLSEIYNIYRQYDKSMEMAKKALSFKPNNYEALFYLAHAYFKKGNYEEAIKLYNQALNVVSEEKQIYGLQDYRVWGYLANAYYKKENFKEALRACGECLKEKSNYLPALQLKRKLEKKLKLH